MVDIPRNLVYVTISCTITCKTFITTHSLTNTPDVLQISLPAKDWISVLGRLNQIP